MKLLYLFHNILVLIVVKKLGNFKNFKKFTCIEMHLAGLPERGIPKTLKFLTFLKSTQKTTPS
jgi:hypothetical protein